MRREVPVEEAERLYDHYRNWRRVAVHLRFMCRTNFTADAVQSAVNRKRRARDEQRDARLRDLGN